LTVTDAEFAKYLRAVRAERRRLEREVAEMAAGKATYEVSIGFMTRADVLKLLLEALEADDEVPPAPTPC
jgi:hypothetical protein